MGSSGLGLSRDGITIMESSQLVSSGWEQQIVLLTSGRPVLYWSSRYGRGNEPFMMPKFRTMRNETPELPTRDLVSPQQFITPLGRFFREYSLDELPQLWSILCGKMSLIGPRPVILSERYLAAQRATAGVCVLRPGLTGWAQVNGRDYLEADEKAEFDKYYLDHRCFLFDLEIAIRTVAMVAGRKNILH